MTPNIFLTLPSLCLPRTDMGGAGGTPRPCSSAHMPNVPTDANFSLCVGMFSRRHLPARQHPANSTNTPRRNASLRIARRIKKTVPTQEPSFTAYTISHLTVLLGANVCRNNNFFQCFKMHMLHAVIRIIHFYCNLFKCVIIPITQFQ